MKKLSIAAALLIAFGTVTFAQDAPAKKAAPAKTDKKAAPAKSTKKAAAPAKKADKKAAPAAADKK
jgi:hypothetical protein